MHSHGYIHRDIKLDNIFLKRDGKRKIVKVGDFGTARKLDASGKRMKGFYGNAGSQSPDMF